MKVHPREKDTRESASLMNYTAFPRFILTKIMEKGHFHCLPCLLAEEKCGRSISLAKCSLNANNKLNMKVHPREKDTQESASLMNHTQFPRLVLAKVMEKGHFHRLPCFLAGEKCGGSISLANCSLNAEYKLNMKVHPKEKDTQVSASLMNHTAFATLVLSKIMEKGHFHRLPCLLAGKSAEAVFR